VLEAATADPCAFRTALCFPWITAYEGNVMKKKERSAGLRAFNALCAIALLCSGLYVLFAGFQVVAVAAMVCATAGVAAPVVASGEGVLEVLVGILEALLDGIMGIFEAIAGLFG
jgi:uncharacterized membrane protein